MAYVLLLIPGCLQSINQWIRHAATDSHRLTWRTGGHTCTASGLAGRQQAGRQATVARPGQARPGRQRLSVCNVTPVSTCNTRLGYHLISLLRTDCCLPIWINGLHLFIFSSNVRSTFNTQDIIHHQSPRHNIDSASVTTEYTIK